MDLTLKNPLAWSEKIFGGCDLGDKRLTNRLVQMGKQLSMHSGKSLAASCDSNSAQLEGAYRFIRNDNISAEEIANGVFNITAQLAETADLLLAIEDTTTLSYKHKLREKLGDIGGPEKSNSRGFIIHTTMLMDASTEKSVGLIAQQRWCRDSKTRGKRHARHHRAYEEKESYKWEKNIQQLEARLGEKLSNVISVCDREADIFEYLAYKHKHNQRFIVRCCRDRYLPEHSELFSSRIEAAEVLGEYKFEVGQKGGRKKRTVTIVLRTIKITLCPGSHTKGLSAIPVNVVIATERNPTKEDEQLEWILLTNEPVGSFKQAREISHYYELRWRIEDFHKAWKTGVRVESQRMQSINNLEKMIVILGFTALRLLQLKEHFEQGKFVPQLKPSEEPSTTLLTKTQWQVLWRSVEKKKDCRRKRQRQLGPIKL